MIHDLIILFIPVYVSSNDTPHSTLEDQTRVYDDFPLDYFDLLHGLSCSGTQAELGGSQLGGAPPTGTQEGGGT
jgi:hypothetical protein